MKMAVSQILPLIFVILITLIFIFRQKSKNSIKPSSSSTQLPKSYPIFGTYFAASANKHRRLEWFTELLQNSPTATFVINHLIGPRQIITANPDVVRHILSSNFCNYQKGESIRVNLTDFLGDGIFCADGKSWKFQRQISSYEFNNKSLRKFVETVVDSELNDRLLPFLSAAADRGSGNGKILDLQDLLQRFAFDNICKIAFGYDPAYLLPSLPESKFAVAFDEATKISGERSVALIPLLWKIKRFIGIGSQRDLAVFVSEVRNFAMTIIKEKNKELAEKSSLESVDLLSRFLSTGHSNEKFVTDIVISFILAGRDTTSAALTCGEKGREGYLPSLCDGENGIDLGKGLGGVQAGAVAGVGGEDGEVEVCRERSVQLSGFSGGAEDLFGEGNGVLADEEGCGRSYAAVRGGFGGGRRC
uniref:Cytochrome P450 n=1 Tax=Cannabis sativa TaxID=3483 RepID=A0A803PGR6_CANSA